VFLLPEPESFLDLIAAFQYLKGAYRDLEGMQ